MEIHAPKPPHTLKDFLLELLTVTIGILIALSLEGVVQWVHHRNLVHEAEANLTTEIGENQRELKTALDSLLKTQAQLVHLLDLIHDVELNRKKASELHFSINWTIAELHETSWNTAASTGALAYMGYPVVKRYTRVYDLQQKFQDFQARGFEAAVSVYGETARLPKEETRISDAQLADAARATGRALATVDGLRGVAQALAADYAEVEQQH